MDSISSMSNTEIANKPEMNTNTRKSRPVRSSYETSTVLFIVGKSLGYHGYIMDHVECIVVTIVSSQNVVLVTMGTTVTNHVKGVYQMPVIRKMVSVQILLDANLDGNLDIQIVIRVLYMFCFYLFII